MLILFFPSVFRFVIVHFHLPTALQSCLIIVNYLMFCVVVVFQQNVPNVLKYDIQISEIILVLTWLGI